MKEKGKAKEPQNGTSGDQRNYPPPKFEVGRIIATDGANQALEANETVAYGYVMQHASSNSWTELEDPEDPAKTRILTYHTLRDGTRLRIVTSADRKLTRVSLMGEK